MSTNIEDRVNTSRTKVTPKSIKRKKKIEIGVGNTEISTEETYYNTKIKIAENVCSFKIENDLLKSKTIS